MPLSVPASARARRSRCGQTCSALRAEVARWFGPGSGARVTRFGRIYPGGSRYVSVRASRPGRCFALYFFHHGVDDWRIYPPWGVGPSIVYWSVKTKLPASQAAGPKKRFRVGVKS
ncbi:MULTISPECIES: hypothetical protein [Caballeronia]|jgi:hypothetical protein|uniref:Uncharacterized protein n=1 Tax=Caballeronia zhejiangensis TaxID=871203 RepID=A0A656QHQ5_9BURK|nr:MULTISPECIES: hypothetical protein [Caballeronia]KDR29890.1 hypothetical protein BG60_05110 [Caballeronia zhejiangensis]MDR5764864.1 hypothetical protein [Caballeronia sp. LZ028]